MRTGKPYMSIGEVLTALKPEFPDVSVSKIRFLEAEGLLETERTPSGYRKFYQRDLDRLRFVLKLQRDSYLPLKVIRDRLAAAESGIATTETIATPAAVPARAQESNGSAEAVDEEDVVGPPPARVKLSESDLAGASGLELGQVRSLREFGVLCAHGDNGQSWFDHDDLTIARVARDLLKLGMEARHLRLFRRSAEQEAGLFLQLVAPALRNRRPEARKQAAETLNELTRLSRRLRVAHFRQAFGSAIDGDR